ncbi:MAG TPA: hypothetical protein VER98_11670, partial [Terriglobia bacterium]|nr:hypothetical protein [Terriglobia bacterium]
AGFVPSTMIRRTLLGLLLSVLVLAVPLFAAGGRNPEPNAAMTSAIINLDREAAVDPESPMLLAFLIEKEYGTREEELKWALNQKLNWGQITALAYIQATTGKSFAEMSRDNAPRDFWSYAEDAGMNCAKMAHSLDGFLKRVERERNSRIFDRLRVSRRVHPLPDLGSGFGLVQESLDFHRIDSPRGPTKIHQVPGELAKGEK